MKQFTYILIFLSSLTIFSQKKQIHFSEVINIAAKQRMLGQKMIKDKLFITYNKNGDIAEIELKNTIAEFSIALEILKDFSQNETIKYKVDVLELTFKNVKKLLKSRSKKSIIELVEMNTLFLKMCDSVFQSFLKTSIPNGKNHLFKDVNKAIHISGSLRYLTQRLALYQAIHAFKIRTVYPDEFYDLIIKIEKGLNTLTISEFNTLAIDDTLSRVLYYWNKLKLELHKKGKTATGMSKIKPVRLFTLSNSLLDKIDPVVKMYTEYAETLK